MKFHHVMSIAVLTVLAGCQNQDADITAGETARNKEVTAQSDICGTTKVDSFLGMKADEAAKQSILEAVGPREVRYLAPGNSPSPDQSPARLNADLDAEGRIAMFWCG